MRKALLIAVTSALLCSLLVASVRAGEGYSTLFATFNSASFTDITLDEIYEGSFSADISNKLTQYSDKCAVLQFSNQTGSCEALQLQMFGSKVVDFLYVAQASNIKIGTTTLATLNDTISLRISGSQLDITVGDTIVVEDFYCNFNVSVYSAKGASTNVTTDGFMQVEIGGGLGGSMMNSITDYLPMILEFSMLGMIVGLIAKFGKGQHR